MRVASLDEQRLAFGRVAELYHEARPSYPASAIDAVLAYARLGSGERIVEVGAGTGIATALLAERGLAVLALEPSAEMARVARDTCAGYPRVEIVGSQFEDWRPAEPVGAIVAAAAWHWIAPEIRYARAREALRTGGTLAALWTFPDWERCALRTTLGAAYRGTAPGLAPSFPMHPDSQPTRLAGDWHAEVAAAGGLTDPVMSAHPWERAYSSEEYTRLLRTHQDHILLGDGERAALLAAVAAAIDAAGGRLALPLVTHVCLARRRP